MEAPSQSKLLYFWYSSWLSKLQSMAQMFGPVTYMEDWHGDVGSWLQPAPVLAIEVFWRVKQNTEFSFSLCLSFYV